MSYFVSFNADHANHNLTFVLGRATDPGKVKIFVCSYEAGNYQKKLFNTPGAPIWAYVVLSDAELKDVKEGHVREDIVEGHFAEISHQHLRSISKLPYKEQRFP